MNIEISETNAKRTFFVLVAAYLLYVAARIWQMPEVMATHFGIDGRADGWMSRSSFLVVSVALAALAVGMRWFIGFTGRLQKGINIPGYNELSAEGKTVFAEVMQHKSWLFGCLFIGFLFVINMLTISTNQMASGRLAVLPVLLLTVVFLAAILWWVLTLVSTVQRLRKQGL